MEVLFRNPGRRAVPQAKDLSSAIWLVVMMCTIGIAGIIAVLVYAMARPIKRLSGAMSQVQEGDFTGARAKQEEG